MKLYKVGGCVRDTFLGMPSKDIDYAVEASSFDQMRQEMIDKGFNIFLKLPNF